jgi:penicillin-binding protein 1A
MMQDVINHGTAARAKQLGRTDLAGKTGTTSNFIDAWFCGFQKDLVAVAWIGYDEPQSLGNNETGGRVALPIWMQYMSAALENVPMAQYIPPEGIVTDKINPKTGLRVSSNGITEYFLREQLPPMTENYSEDSGRAAQSLRDQLF